MNSQAVTLTQFPTSSAHHPQTHSDCPETPGKDILSRTSPPFPQNLRSRCTPSGPPQSPLHQLPNLLPNSHYLVLYQSRKPGKHPQLLFLSPSTLINHWFLGILPPKYCSSSSSIPINTAPVSIPATFFLDLRTASKLVSLLRFSVLQIHPRKIPFKIRSLPRH